MESGLQFDFSYAAGTSLEQMLAFETAGLMWSDYIKDDMTVNIHVEMTDYLPDNVIGGALPGMVADVNYTDFRNAYWNDKQTWRDDMYFNSLPLFREGSGGKGPGGTWEKFEARIDFGGDHFVEDSSELNMTRANAKALGLIGRHDAGLDGLIKMNKLSDNSGPKWDYNRNWTPANSLDFLSTAVHEVGHILGFVSGVDKYEGVKFNDIGSFWNHFGTYDNFKNYTNDVLDYANPLDLFRYTQKSLDINSGRNTIDMSIGTQAFFGPAKLWDAYATGKETSLDGDGFQASHWRHSGDNSKIIGVMDPLMQTGVTRRISNRDLRAMDAIGYDVTSSGNKLLDLDVKLGIWKPMTAEGTDIGTDIGALEWRGKDRVVKKGDRGGQASWYQDWVTNKRWKANEIARDRSWDIDYMIDRSQVYEGRRDGRTYSRQEIFHAESYFSSIPEQYFDVPAEYSFDADAPIIFEPGTENQSEPNFDPLKTETNSSQNQQAITVNTVEMELIVLTEQNTIKFVSTDLNSELTESASLYGDRLISNLAIPLA